MRLFLTSVLLFNILLLGSCSEDSSNNKRPTNSNEENKRNALGANAQTNSYGFRVVKEGVKAQQISYGDETLDIKDGKEPRIAQTPSINYHHDGVITDDIILHVNRESIDEDATCGLSEDLKTIQAKIKDCVKLNLNWDGAISSIQGEGKWQLVTRTREGFEVWFDMQTQLLWSDSLGVANWCQASGNKEIATASDRVDCLEAGKLANWCGDPIDRPLSEQHIKAKGYLANDLVQWRIPSRKDLIMAELNGLRFIHPKKDYQYWTGTISSEDFNFAWIFSMRTAQTFKVQRDLNTYNQQDVRVLCMGRVIGQ